MRCQPVDGRRRTDAILAGLLLLLLLLLLQMLVVDDLSWWVSTSIFAKVDLESLVFLLAPDSLNCLDCVGNVGKVHKSTALLPQRIDELNLPILLKVLSQAVLRPRLVQIAHIYVSRGSTRYCQCDGGRQRSRVLAPADFESPVVNHQALQVAESIKRGSRSGIDECDETDVLVGDVSNVVQQAAPYHVADFLNGRLGVNVAQIYRSIAQVIHSAGSGRHRSCSNGLLRQSIRNEVAIRAVQDMCITRGNSQVLRCILLLSL